MAIVKSWLRPGDIAVDVGANIGTYTLLMAASVGPTGRVIAFEPAEAAQSWLRENIELNHLDHVQIIGAAAGRSSGRAAMTTQADVSNTLAPGPGTYEVTDVEVRTIDEVLHEATPALLKVDVEGYEAEALAGATKALTARPLIVTEFDDTLLRRGGSSADEVTDMLNRAGYRLCFPSANGGRITLGDIPANNVVAVPEEHWERFTNLIDAIVVPSRVR